MSGGDAAGGGLDELGANGKVWSTDRQIQIGWVQMEELSWENTNGKAQIGRV